MTRAGWAALMGGALMVSGAAAMAMLDRGFGLGPAETVATGGAGVPTVALDPSGEHGYVAWIAPGEGGSAVFVATAGGGQPVRVNDVAGDAAAHDQAPAQVAAGPDGAVYVLWQNNREIPGRKYPASNLRFSRSADRGRSWSPAVTVNSDRDGAPSSHTFHDLVVAADGTLYASWIDGRARDAERARRGPAPPPAPGAGHHHGGEDPTLPQSEIRVVRSTDGGRTWGEEMIVDAAVCPCCRTSLATGPDGSVYVAWRKIFAGDVRDVVIARLAPGATAFAAPVRVHEDGWVFHGCPHAGPSVVVDAAGTVSVSWYTGQPGRQGLWMARAGSDLRFGEPSALITAAYVPPSQTALATAGDRVRVVWDDRRTPSGGTLIANAGGRPESLGAHGKSPALAMAGGRTLAAWVDRGAIQVKDSRR